MAKSKFPLHLKILALALFSLAFTLLLPTIVISQSVPKGISEIHFSPPQESAPMVVRRQELRSRCPCYNSINSLTALLPPTSLALTTADRPTFFLYVPHATATKSVTNKDDYACNKTVSNSNLRETFEVEFELLDEQEEKIYQTAFTIAGTPGVISFTLPKDSPPLELTKYYRWYFEVICDPEDRSGDSVVSGWTRRVELIPNLAQELAQASPTDRPAIYARSGLWHDTLTALAQLRKSQPNDLPLANAWAELLKSVGLDNISQEPLVECCNIAGERS
ncbi:DUF928 domain-containing protein [Kamptonema animale CS-326]|jgi:hypothetical protein|uniref:DUF928 domain-containing protein n=1 Tax=Kamptonema animale TaxID=92934 RepID=UPI00232EA41C|nr:DUF928 domain-containing protein [Kamptonema animale]MDB9514594.1 DUF928 domain-containing protein [Kamptonema animale CS-326]